MFSEIRVRGPRLPAGLLSLPAAMERIGALVVPDWVGIKPIGPHADPKQLGAEREAAALADEGHAVANVFEPSPELAPSPADAVCSTCRKPATRIRAGHSYCDRHGKRQPVPAAIRKLIARTAAAAAARGAPDTDADEAAGDDDRPAPDQAALFRWAKANVAICDKVFADELPAWLREPGGKISRMTAAEWREDGFPAPDEAMARLPSRRHVPMHVIFDVADLERVFAVAETEVGPDVSRPRSPRRVPHSIGDVQPVVDQYLKEQGVIDDKGRQVKKALPAKTFLPALVALLPGCARQPIRDAVAVRQPPRRGAPKKSPEEIATN